MAPKEIREILTETLACFLPGRAKDLSSPLYYLDRGFRGFPQLQQLKRPRSHRTVKCDTGCLFSHSFQFTNHNIIFRSYII